ncbi:hypothetical protein, partial [Klebsiella pneumoniae]|uniref:hypothetical protein n=1 Tax=Klebsiella pneumoniae TaxID=573 RepID=UPI0025A12282
FKSKDKAFLAVDEFQSDYYDRKDILICKSLIEAFAKGKEGKDYKKDVTVYRGFHQNDQDTWTNNILINKQQTSTAADVKKSF